MASYQTLPARSQSAVIFRSASQISFVAASSVGKFHTSLDDLAQPGVDALYGLGGVDHSPDLRWEGVDLGTEATQEEREMVATILTISCTHG